MRDDAGEVAFLGDADHLLHACHDTDAVVGLVADVALVDAAHLADDLRERNHFLGLRVAPRRVVEA